MGPYGIQVLPRKTEVVESPLLSPLINCPFQNTLGYPGSLHFQLHTWALFLQATSSPTAGAGGCHQVCPHAKGQEHRPRLSILGTTHPGMRCPLSTYYTIHAEIKTSTLLIRAEKPRNPSANKAIPWKPDQLASDFPARTGSSLQRGCYQLRMALVALKPRLWGHKEVFAPCPRSLSSSSPPAPHGRAGGRTHPPRQSSITKPPQTRPGEVESPTSLNITESTQISPWAPHYTDYTLITSSAIKGFSNSTSVLRGSVYGRESTLTCVCHAHGGDHGLPALPARLGGSLAQSRVPWVLALPGWHTAVPSLVTASPWRQVCVPTSHSSRSRPSRGIFRATGHSPGLTQLPG